ncbi:MAG: GNAT family N-acetyltransferase [Patescibacteria group bacterium]|nr:GNAT family N-acetyltransferase [Patescibacteria group bacterium]
MELYPPSNKYKDSYISGLKEMLLESPNPKFLKTEIDNFDIYLSQFTTSNNEPVAKGIVPFSEYWLINEEKYVGTVQIRHEASGRFDNIKSHIYFHIIPSRRRQGYGNKILSLGLKKSRILGLNKVMITCDKKNVASRKIIENNNGILINEIMTGVGSETILKYLIKIK